MRTYFLNFLTMLLVALFLGCGGTPRPKLPSQAGQAGAINTLSSIVFNDSADKFVVQITAQNNLTPNVFKLTDPLRVIIDFTDTQLGEVKSPIAVNNGIVNEIVASQFDDIASSLSRVVIGFDSTAEYNVLPNKNSLTVEISKTGVASTQEPKVEPNMVEGMGSEPLTSAAIPETLNSQVSDNPEENLANIPIESSSDATALSGIDFQVSGETTSLSIRADGAINSYEEFVLENPKRLVVDLKGLALAYKAKPKLAVSSGIVRTIRTGAHSDKIRIVLDFKPNSTPNYNIEKVDNGLNINVSPDLIAAAPTESAPVPTFINEPSTTQPEIGPEVVAISELPLDMVPVEDPFAKTAAAEVTPEFSEVSSALPEPDMPTMDVPVAANRTVDVKAVNFTQDTSKSRLTIETSDLATYEKSDDGKLLLITLKKARIKSSVARVLDTRQFNSSVTQIAPRQVGQDTRIAISMKTNTHYTINQEGNALYVDFDRETVSAAAVAPAESSEPALPPEVSGPETTAVAPELPIAESKVVEPPPTEVTDQAYFEPAPPAGDAGKKFEYVKEELLSDAMNKKNGEGFGDDMIIIDESSSRSSYTGRKINLDFKDADIRALFRLFADISKLNIIVGDDVSGKVTIKLDDVPWDQAFAILLQTQTLGAIKYGNIIRIAPAEKIQKEREVHAQAKKAAVAAAPMDTLFKAVSYAEAIEVATRVKNVLSDRGTVDVDARTSTLIIRDIREKLSEAKKLIEKLDAQTPQVTIESRIVEATTRFVRNWGVRWGGAANFNAGTGNPTGLLFPNAVGVQGAAGAAFLNQPVVLDYPATGSNASTAISLGSLNGVLDLDLLLGYEEREGNAKLISSPKITVLDNKSATITSGTKIPYVTQTANSGSSVRFESAAISIGVTPHITADGSVIMKLQISRNEPEFGLAVQGNPSITQREANTEVLVKSGNTTVIGGIYRINRNQETSGFPFLRRIPLLGYLFSNDNRRLDRQELLIFITPRIVGDERTVVKQIQG